MKVKFNAGLVVLLASTCFAAKFRTYFEKGCSQNGIPDQPANFEQTSVGVRVTR